MIIADNLTNIISITETHQDVSHSKVDDVDVGGGLHVFPHQDDHHHQRVTSDADLKSFRVRQFNLESFDDLIKIIWMKLSG